MKDLVYHDVHVEFLDKHEGNAFNTNGRLLRIRRDGIEVTQGTTGLQPLWYPMLRIAHISHAAYCNQCQQSSSLAK